MYYQKTSNETSNCEILRFAITLSLTTLHTIIFVFPTKERIRYQNAETWKQFVGVFTDRSNKSEWIWFGSKKRKQN